MDYEKKYKEALGWMQSLYNGLHGKTKEEAERYFPELAESDGERIRKTLIDLVKCNERSGYNSFNNVTTSSMLAWLEKQKPSNELQEYKSKLEENINNSILFYCNSGHDTQVTRNSDLGAVGALINLKVNLGFSLFRWERLMYEGKCLPF